MPPEAVKHVIQKQKNMAFGFSPKYVKEIELIDQAPNKYLVIALEAAQKLKWEISYVNETGFRAFTRMSFASYSEEVILSIENGVAKIKSECTSGQLMDWGKNETNVGALLIAIDNLKSSFSEEEMELKLNEIRHRISLYSENTGNRSPLEAKTKMTSLASFFKPQEGYFISPILIILNILVFVAMLISGVHILMPENQDLLNWGANFRPLTLDGQLWRLFTACFLHIGILHLLMNMYALLYIGLLLEPYLGKTRFLAAYLITGIAASVASLWWHELTISAGASGAIFGMYGVFLALLSTNILEKSAKKALLTSIAIFVGYNILNGLKPDSGIDNAAHIGGLLSGLVIGFGFVPSLKQFENKTVMFSTIGIMSLVLVVSSMVVVKDLPNDIAKYDERMLAFFERETKALEVFNLPPDTSTDRILFKLKDHGIELWQKNIELVDSLQMLDLPAIVKTRNTKLREYCELRIKVYELIYKAIAEDTESYQNEIDAYNQKIEAVFTELTK